MKTSSKSVSHRMPVVTSTWPGLVWRCFGCCCLWARATRIFWPIVCLQCQNENEAESQNKMFFEDASWVSLEPKISRARLAAVEGTKPEVAFVIGGPGSGKGKRERPEMLECHGTFVRNCNVEIHTGRHSMCTLDAKFCAHGGSLWKFSIWSMTRASLFSLRSWQQKSWASSI